MVRGCEKRIYHIKNPESDIFDEAYFVLRRRTSGRNATPGEIEREAKRIVRESYRDSGSASVKRSLKKAFFAGAGLSALVVGLVSLVLFAVLC